VATRGTRIDEVSVDGGPAYFISGKPHFLILLDRKGQSFGETVRLVRNVLIWARDGVAYRLEGELTKERAIELAESLG
jgi:hypothetical protein